MDGVMPYEQGGRLTNHANCVYRLSRSVGATVHNAGLCGVACRTQARRGQSLLSVQNRQKGIVATICISLATTGSYRHV